MTSTILPYWMIIWTWLTAFLLRCFELNLWRAISLATNPFWKHVLWSWEFRRFTFSLSPRGALSQIVKRRAVPVKWRFHTYKKSRPIIPGGWNDGGLGLCANACGVRFLTTVQGLSPKQFRFDTSCLLDILPLRPHNMIKTRHLILSPRASTQTYLRLLQSWPTYLVPPENWPCLWTSLSLSSPL